MNNVLLEIIVFFALVAQGALTRLAYIPTAFMQRKVSSKLFTAVTDVLTALIGAGSMMLTCILLTGSVRIFYALFFLGGLTAAHVFLRKYEKLNESDPAPEKPKKKLLPFSLKKPDKKKSDL